MAPPEALQARGSGTESFREFAPYATNCAVIRGSMVKVSGERTTLVTPAETPVLPLSLEHPASKDETATATTAHIPASLGRNGIESLLGFRRQAIGASVADSQVCALLSRLLFRPCW